MAHTIIAINRQSGSGGAFLGAKIGEMLGLPVYDKQLVEMAVKLGGLDKTKHAKVFQKVKDERPNPMFYRLYNEGNDNVTPNLSPQDTIFDLQRQLIEDIASREDAVFVGRAANFYLMDQDVKLLSVYICGSLDSRAKRCAERGDMSIDQAARYVKQVDKQRNDFYHHVTGTNRSDLDYYTMVLNSGLFTDDQCLAMLKAAYEVL